VTRRIGQRGASVRAAVAASVLAVVAAACAGSPATPRPSALPVHDIGIANGTTLTVTLTVNDRAVGRFASHSVSTVQVRAAYPWHVEARASTGRILVSLDINPGDIESASSAGGDEHSAAVQKVDLSCGRLVIYGGDVQPGVDPSVGPGAAGDCGG